MSENNKNLEIADSIPINNLNNIQSLNENNP
jgi:hypothetical protein